jgi:hypothetical protein
MRVFAWRSLLAVLVLAGATSAALTSAAQATPKTVAASQVDTWFWTPGWCKSDVQRFGMRISDGRTFNIERSFCVGIGGQASCAWNNSYSQRLYSRFAVFSYSYDGAVRGFRLHPTGRTGYEATRLRILGHGSMAIFDRYIGRVAYALAHQEHDLGCGLPVRER